jgi:hypothetical protein
VNPDPWPNQIGVVIAGHDDYLSVVPELRAELSQNRFSSLHRLGGAPLEQLDDIAKENQALDAVQGLDERLERLGMIEDVPPQATAQVEVRDDERSRRPAAPALGDQPRAGAT